MWCSQGFYVLVDYHAYPGDMTVSSGNLVNDWTTLWQAIVGLPSFGSELAGRVFVDLINEPDGINVFWEPNDGNPGLETLYIDVMDALVAVDDRVIFFVEGAGQTGYGCSWGG